MRSITVGRSAPRRARREARSGAGRRPTGPWVAAALAAALLAALPGPAARSQERSCIDLSCELLRNRIEIAGLPLKVAVGSDAVLATEALPLFYERRAYRPAWIDDDGLLPRVDSLVRAIRGAEDEGLRACDYHIASLESFVAQVRENEAHGQPDDPARYVELELLLTDAFLVYASHLLNGKTDPVELDAEWHVIGGEADLALVLESAVEGGSVEEALTSLLPQRTGYARLREALARYRRLSTGAGWPEVAEGPTIGLGDVDERVGVLRDRLRKEGYLSGDPAGDPNAFDETLEGALVRFQQHRGLDADGRVGRDTIASLNVPAWARVEQIELNLERWRWLPRDLGERFAVVNIANFQLYVVEGEDVVLDMRVVVGRDYRRTPVFSDQLRYIVFAPYWNVPRSIAVKDMLPKIQKDAGYLARGNFKVFEGWGANERHEVDPATVDWASQTPGGMPYRFRQEPCPNNALGRVKFMFPNEFSVYLHDTPAKALFSKNVRAFSSGCIRAERPIELAEYLLAEDPEWSRETIMEAMNATQEKTVSLPEPVPIHILYWTAWAGTDGSVHFRNDIYERDKPLEHACETAAPAI